MVFFRLKPPFQLSLDAIDPHTEKMINPADTLRDIWKKCFDLDIDPVLVTPLGGGSINAVYKAILPEETVVMKVNSAARFPGMFAAEQRGLDILRKYNSPPIPNVICQTTIGQYQYLVLEYLERGPRRRDFFEHFAQQLATLHRNTTDVYGLDHDNYIGALPQYNHAHADLYQFLIEQRFQPQLKLAVDTGRLTSQDLQLFTKLFSGLPAMIPNEPPSLIHGDLWSGNYLTGPEGDAWLIDPAVAWVHREADLAMSRLFGGFDPEFYDSYNEVFALSPGFEQRIDLWNLYPLLVHVNLFGGNYIGEVRSIVKKYTV